MNKDKPARRPFLGKLAYGMRRSATLARYGGQWAKSQVAQGMKEFRDSWQEATQKAREEQATQD